MSFLHPEFLFWLLPLSFLLFYFWLTQKPLQNRWLSEAVLEKLRAPETTMGLKGRNILFLVSSVLIILAMAQPVIIDSTPIEGKELHVVIAIDRSNEHFEQIRSLARSTLYSVLGENIELMAYDEKLYEIAPRSNDGGILGELIRHLAPSDKPSNRDVLTEKLAQRKADMTIIITSIPFKMEGMMLVASPSDVLVVHEKLLELRNNHRIQAHIPLFFYPLGLAMVLILFALSSMSKRQSVSVGIVLFALSLFPMNSHAGILDFKELIKAREAYEAGEYEKAERLFARHQMKHDSPQVRYNRANALYMSGRYERARYWYERVYTADPMLQKRLRYNLEQSRAKIEMSKADRKKIEKRDQQIQTDGVNSTMQPKRLPRETKLFEW
ncbi:tetratricopeptide repeat protein [Sulfuricurvum sp.]|uniref:tetratricopeptide repeat protein n=1 Tax=Sulfuricurvum sp. TaxID=2025608 RepID=UPI002632D238|nr:tetratricopeptide repeat protein [Sulfuricurvum sp.]MDD2780221.1 tetratricopeptide repeat protein [Sulfuricurvum sp.]